MFDWHSEYTVIQARQQEMAAAARMGRLAAEAKSAARQDRHGQAAGKVRLGVVSGGSARSAPSRRLRYRLGAALVQLGRRLQGGASELPAASG